MIVIKKLLYVIVGIAFSLCMVNICSAERVFVYHEKRNKEYTGVDVYIETSEIKKGIVDDTAVRNGKRIYQYGVFVPIEHIVAETGKRKYRTSYYIFFKNKYGEWLYGHESSDDYIINKKVMPRVNYWGGNKFSTKYRTKEHDIFDKANEYFDFNSIENTNADERGVFEE